MAGIKTNELMSMDKIIKATPLKNHHGSMGSDSIDKILRKAYNAAYFAE